MKTEFRRHLLASSLLIGASAVVATPAMAQDNQVAANTANNQPIVVTGSRIPQLEIESTSPLQVVDAQEIDESGVTNIQELLLENPAFGTPAFSRTNTAFLTSGTGVATVDLRDLGSNRTLVLVNGRRVVAGLAGSATVDLNVIPVQFLERVDVLTGGASSLYGSDAIAGVVNFVYRRDFQGIEANAQYGITERGDDPRYQANLTVGTDVVDGRGNIMVHFGYSNEEGLLARERPETFTDALSAIFFGGDVRDQVVPFFSSFPPQGRFDVNGTATSSDDFTFDPQGVLRPCFSTNGGTAPASCGAFAGQQIGPDGFNRQFFRTLAVPVERYLFAAAGNYEVTDGINLFFEGTYNRTAASRIIEPFPLASSDIFQGSGRVPIEFAVTRDFDNDPLTPDTTQLVVNPLVPAAIVAAAQDVDGDGARDYGFVRRSFEFGPRRGNTTRDFYRFVIGFDGTLFDDRFSWDVSYNYGQTTENQTSNGQINTVNARLGLMAIPDFDDADGDGSTTDAICLSAEARADGCVPVSFFGRGSLTPEMLAYMNAQQSFQTDITQQVVQANIGGSLWELPGGPVGIAAGVEYRRESSLSDNDALTNLGLNGGNQLPDTQGSFNVVEGYLEVNLPILADTPGFELLEIGGAVRVADYSTVGTVWSYNVRATWQPFDDIRFRGTYARAVRAPNIGELFAGLSQTFPPGLQDPCAGIGPTGGGTAGDVCRLDAGVNANIAANGVFTLTQADIQGISGFNGGNPNLGEETADSWTIGAIITPVSLGLDNLTITVDYYDIEVETVIASPPRAFSLAQCYNQNNPEFCQLIIRRQQGDSLNSAGSIEFVNALQINGAVLQTNGLDVTAAYRTPVNIIGDAQLSARITYTHVFNGDFAPSVTAPFDPFDGEYGTSKDRFSANLNYEQGQFAIAFTGNYIGPAVVDQAFCVDCGDRVSAEFYLDTQVTWAVTDNFEWYFGIDNIFDNDAPSIPTGVTGNVTGADTAADVYDIFGRRYYSGVRLRF